MFALAPPALAKTRIVALVLNWNAWADTISCCESLLASERAPDRIVICDNGSVDSSVERIAAWARARSGFTHFSSPSAALNGDPVDSEVVLVEVRENLGYAGGNNIGIRYALELCGADFVWILNSDVVVDRKALQNMLDVAEQSETIGIVGSKLLRHDEPDTIQALGGGYIIPVLCHDTQLGSGRKEATAGTAPIKLDHLVGASLLVRAEAVRRVGLIDESYFLYREETDWCIRMRRGGWQLYCCTQASVWHKQSHSIGFKSPLHDYYAVRNMLYLVRKFYPVTLPAAFGYFACRSIAPKLMRLEFARLAAVLTALRDFLSGVNGRAERHSDAALARNYLRPHLPPVVKRMWWRPAALASLVAAGIAALAAAILNGGGTARTLRTMGAPLHPAVAQRDQQPASTHDTQ